MSRDTPLIRSGFLVFFRSFYLAAVRFGQRLLTAFLSEEPTERVCTTHVRTLAVERIGERLVNTPKTGKPLATYGVFGVFDVDGVNKTW